jgi:hypothetical protein
LADIEVGADLDCSRPSVLRRIGEHLRYHVVGGYFNRCRQPVGEGKAYIRRDGGSSSEFSQRRAQSGFGQDCGVYPVRDFAKFVVDLDGVGDADAQAVASSLEIGAGLSCGLQSQSECDEALLCAVVQIASDAAAGFVCGGDESCP